MTTENLSNVVYIWPTHPKVILYFDTLIDFFFYINFFPNKNLEYMITFWELLLFVKLKSIFKCQIMIQKCQFDAKLVLSFFCHCCHCHIVVTIFVIVSIVTTVALIWFLSESLELENRKYLVSTLKSNQYDD